jgi:single-strand DNA-binding protein
MSCEFAPRGYLSVGRSANSAEADFFRIKAWNSQAEAAGDHLGKGRRIAVEGSLRQDVYEKDGEERKAVSVVAKRLEYL